MRTHDVLETLRGALQRGELPATRVLLADDAVLHVPGRSGLSGPYRGRSAICALLDKLQALTDRSLRFHTERAVTGGDLTVLLGEFACRRGGRARRAAAVLAVTVTAGGISEIRLFHHDRPGLDDLC